MLNAFIVRDQFYRTQIRFAASQAAAHKGRRTRAVSSGCRIDVKAVAYHELVNSGKLHPILLRCLLSLGILCSTSISSTPFSMKLPRDTCAT